jgi:phosphatidylglycerophosphate synthase
VHPASVSKRTFIAQGAAIAASLGVLLALSPFMTSRAPMLALLLFATGVFLAVIALDRHHPHPRFGLANSITLLRLGGVALFASLAAEPEILSRDSLEWLAVAGAVFLLAMDGIDGWSARRQGLASKFGARFDMEVDAAFILVLSVLALVLDKAGPWVLGLGLMRYAFVFAGSFAPALRAPLPPSFRRKAVCVGQILALTIMLVPQITPVPAAAIAGTALAALAWSFAVDIVWLLRNPR